MRMEDWQGSPVEETHPARTYRGDKGAPDMIRLDLPVSDRSDDKQGMEIRR